MVLNSRALQDSPQRFKPALMCLTVNEFWVTVQRSEASERCGLSGNYWLKAESDVLILKEPKTKRRVLVWPYKLLRRYGRDRVSNAEPTKEEIGIYGHNAAQEAHLLTHRKCKVHQCLIDSCFESDVQRPSNIIIWFYFGHALFAKKSELT